MTKKPEIVKWEDLIEREDGLYYKKYARVPFTGAVKDFYENGQLSSRLNYKNGEQDGLTEWFHENGQVGERGYYKNGEREGLTEIFNANGQLSSRYNYKNGE